MVDTYELLSSHLQYASSYVYELTLAVRQLICIDLAPPYEIPLPPPFPPFPQLHAGAQNGAFFIERRRRREKDDARPDPVARR